jgi:hypothetical protein
VREDNCHRLPREMLAPILNSVGRCCSEDLKLASRHRHPSLEVRNSSYWCKAVSVPILLSRHVRFPHMSSAVSACLIFHYLASHRCAFISYLLEFSASKDHVLHTSVISEWHPGNIKVRFRSLSNQRFVVVFEFQSGTISQTSINGCCRQKHARASEV